MVREEFYSCMDFIHNYAKAESAHLHCDQCKRAGCTHSTDEMSTRLHVIQLEMQNSPNILLARLTSLMKAVFMR